MRCRRGTTSIEFAIVGAMFFTMMIGTIEIARLYFTQASLREVSAAAARRAMIDPALEGCSAPAAAVARTTPFLRTGNLRLCVSREVASGQVTLTIDAAYPFSTVMPLFRLEGDQLTERTTVSFGVD
ncbi:TadE/TadG family type IV pilus assembly protein [Geminicoccus roseus]|uniref:TadE/TadG family type IV pilus assembly protein n=1 Tax=Geminicoccus roseus TaxID=404900 RepID=UPI000558A1D5|nr:TadE/TadG family type IV pilus assembly protein [Geminicoccus roseus]